MAIPGDGLYQIISGGPFSTGGKACIRPGALTLIQIVGTSPYNAMMNWRWQPAPGGVGSTLTSDNGLVLCYTPNAGANVQLRAATMINDPSAAWVATDIGGFYCMVSPMQDPSLALTIDDGGPPWQIGQAILADPTEGGASVAQAWMFLALGDERFETSANIPEFKPAAQPTDALASVSQKRNSD